MTADTSVPNVPIKVPCLGGNFGISATCGPRKGAENTAPRSRMGVIAYTNGRARAYACKKRGLVLARMSNEIAKRPNEDSLLCGWQTIRTTEMSLLGKTPVTRS